MRRQLRAGGRARQWVASWWRGEGGALGALLDAATRPAEWGYRGAVALRNKAFDSGLRPATRVAVPVISIGNISVGGAGKTPVSAWVAGQLVGWGRKPAVIMRGYGLDEVGVHRELNPTVSVVTCPQRVKGAREAIAAGADCIVLDDGFQHRGLARDLDVVLVAAEQWGSAGRLLPRGPSREPRGALRRAHEVLVTRKTASVEEALTVLAEIARKYTSRAPGLVWLAPGGLRPLHDTTGSLLPLTELAGKEVLAVATLAEPAPFLGALTTVKAKVEAVLYPDHYVPAAGDLQHLLERISGRILVMTRKEAVKLRSSIPSSVEALVLEQTLVFERGETEFLDGLRRAVEPE